MTNYCATCSKEGAYKVQVDGRELYFCPEHLEQYNGERKKNKEKLAIVIHSNLDILGGKDDKGNKKEG